MNKLSYYDVTIKRTTETEIRIQAESRAEAELKALRYLSGNMELTKLVTETIITSCEA